METTYTLTELLSYAGKLEFETKGWHGAIFDGYLGIGLIIFGTICFLASVWNWRKGQDIYEAIPLIVTSLFIVAFGSVGMIWMFSDMLTAESHDRYDLEERKWEREMVDPFLENLQVTTVSGLQDISYNYEMEAEEDKKFGTSKRTGDAIPVTITTNDDKTYKIWVDVKPLAKDMNDSTLEMKNLEKDLIFHERSKAYKKKGYFDAVLYTDEKI